MKYREDKTLKLLKKLIEERLDLKLMEHTRRADYVYARALFYGLAYNTQCYSLSTIGKYLGKDHATVLHSIKNVLPQVLKVEYYIKIYNELRVFINIGGVDSVKTHEDGVVNLYREIKRQSEQIEALSVQIVKMKINHESVHEAFNGLSNEESEDLVAKMNLHSKVIKAQRSMNEQIS